MISSGKEFNLRVSMTLSRLAAKCSGELRASMVRIKAAAVARMVDDLWDE